MQVDGICRENEIFCILYIFIYILVHTAVCMYFNFLWYISLLHTQKKTFAVCSSIINFSAGNSQKMWRVKSILTGDSLPCAPRFFINFFYSSLVNAFCVGGRDREFLYCAYYPFTYYLLCVYLFY